MLLLCVCLTLRSTFGTCGCPHVASMQSNAVARLDIGSGAQREMALVDQLEGGVLTDDEKTRSGMIIRDQ